MKKSVPNVTNLRRILKKAAIDPRKNPVLNAICSSGATEEYFKMRAVEMTVEENYLGAIVFLTLAELKREQSNLPPSPSVG
jgi:hypothetical protein